MEDEQQEKPKSNSPVCPYCMADPVLITVTDIVFPNNMVIVVAFCGNMDCRKIFSATFKGKAGSLVIPKFGDISK